MHRTVIYSFGLLVYFMVTAVGLYALSAGPLLSAVLLLGVPTFMMARFSAAPTVMVLTIAAFAAGLTFLLEATGYIYGLWSTFSPVGFYVFDFLAVEILILSILKVLFLVHLYELWFDDGVYVKLNAQGRMLEFGLFATGTVLMVASLVLFFGRFQAPSAYYWLTIVLLAATLAMPLLRHTLTLRFFDKVLYFVALAAVPMLTTEVLMFANGFKTAGDVIAPIMLPGLAFSLPLGEILLALSVPAFVTVVYELYLDDQT